MREGREGGRHPPGAPLRRAEAAWASGCWDEAHDDDVIGEKRKMGPAGAKRDVLRAWVVGVVWVKEREEGEGRANPKPPLGTLIPSISDTHLSSLPHDVQLNNTLGKVCRKYEAIIPPARKLSFLVKASPSRKKGITSYPELPRASNTQHNEGTGKAARYRAQRSDCQTLQAV
jgi:hypothetical protein